MIIDRILLYPPPSRIFTGPKDMKRQLRNFIHQQTPLILPMHNRALPHQNTNHRRMKRNGLESQSLWRAAQNLLIAFFFSPVCPFSFPSSLSFPSTEFLQNRCNHWQFAGSLAAGHLPAADRVRARRSTEIYVCESMCEGVVCLMCLHAIVSRKVHFGRTGIHLCIGISV